ncbi:MAG: phosphopantothenoylcysteine decarboxylase [Phycisphaerae bacterium]
MSRQKRLKFLITAGPTREYIDTVRYLSNESSGKMGFALAAEAAACGHAVTLVHGPVALDVPQGVRAVPVVSAAEMMTACKQAWPKADILIKAAAVADYRPASPSKTKLKKSREALTLSLEPTEDILSTLSAMRRPGQVVIGFALEDQNARENAEEKLRRKNLDAIVLNRPTALSADRSIIEALIRDEGWRIPVAASKARLAELIVGLAESLAVKATYLGTAFVRGLKTEPDAQARSSRASAGNPSSRVGLGSIPNSAAAPKATSPKSRAPKRRWLP